MDSQHTHQVEILEEKWRTSAMEFLYTGNMILAIKINLNLLLEIF